MAQSADDATLFRSQSDDESEMAEEEDDSNVEADLDRFLAKKAALRRERAQKAKEAEKSSQWFPTPASNDSGLGIIGQAGHLAFKTFGRNDSITPFEAMPYVLADEHFFFSDIRGFVTNTSTFGGNAGLGYRNLREDLNSWFGGSVWFDMDGSTGKSYQQIGLSFEAMIERLELRSNVYLPITSSQTFANTISNARFSGNQLLYSQYIDQGKALTGVDFEAGYNLPVMEPHRLRAFVGYYRFEGGPSGAINGFKTRLEGVINNTVTAQVMYTNDPLYGSCVMVGCQLQLPFGDYHPASKWKQTTPSPFRFVERNYNVIVDHAQNLNANVVAINPQTNAPYNIEQVNSSAAPGGNGTTTSPFATISAAQGAGADVIFVQGNSIINQSVTLTNGQRLIGDGSSEQLPLPGNRTVVLPNLIAAAQAPQFNGVSGNAVTLGSDSEVAGFKFSNITGSAIVGSNVTNGSIRDDTFTGINGDAIAVTNSAGNFYVSNVTVNSATGDGVKFDGSTANVSISGNINGTQGDGIGLSNFTGGGVTIANTAVSSTTGSGLVMNGVATNANITSLTTSQTQGPAISITGGNSSSNYLFAGTTTIQTPSGSGFTVNNAGANIMVDNLVVTSMASAPAVSLTNSTGPIVLTYLNADTTNAMGLSADQMTSLTVSNGTITSVNAPALNIQTSTIAVNLAQVLVNGGPYGLTLNQDVGTFTILGTTTAGSGGTIQNTTTGLVLDQSGTININWLNLTNNGTGILSTGNNSVTLNEMQITNSSGYALDSLNDAAVTVENSTFSGNGAPGGGTIRGQVDSTSNTNFQWLVQGNTITDTNGTPILLQTEPNGAGTSMTAIVQNNVITASAGTYSLININWDGNLQATVESNTLTAEGGNMTGINIQGTSLTDTTNAMVANNAIAFTENGGTGVMFAASYTNNFEISTNNISFGGVDGIGLHFNLTSPTLTAGSSSGLITTNTITDNAGGATGMLFDNVSSGSRIEVDNNVITLLSTDPTIHRGIYFTAVTPTIQFTSNYNNIISNASSGDLFVAPVNSSTGDLLINGILMAPQ